MRWSDSEENIFVLCLGEGRVTEGRIYLNAGTAGVVGSVRLICGVGQSGQPAYVGLRRYSWPRTEWLSWRSTFGPDLSANPMAYQMQASQWATRAKADMRRMRTAAPYSEYLSIFLATLTRRSRRAVFSRPINVVVWKQKYFTSGTKENISLGKYEKILEILPQTYHHCPTPSV